MSPLFSIVIPTFNRADTMMDTLASCWKQTCTDFEVILVDDGSSDNTRAVAESVEHKALRYIYQDNAGPAAARNTGLDAATGRYIAYLDSDDVWLPDHLAHAKTALETTDNSGSAPDFLYTQIIVDRGVDRYWIKPATAMQTHDSIFDYLYVRGGFIQTSTMIIATHYRETVRWDETVTFGDNDQYAIDLWKAGAIPRMLDTPQTLYADAISADALSQLPVFSGNTEKHTNFLNWMEAQRSLMSEQAWHGFTGHFKSVALARTAPLDSIRLVWRSHQAGVIGLRGVARQLLQNFAPRLYRRIVDQYVRFRGKPMASLNL